MIEDCATNITSYHRRHYNIRTSLFESIQTFKPIQLTHKTLIPYYEKVTLSLCSTLLYTRSMDPITLFTYSELLCPYRARFLLCHADNTRLNKCHEEMCFIENIFRSLFLYLFFFLFFFFIFFYLFFS